jgi:hypothetical protein
MVDFLVSFHQGPHRISWGKEVTPVLYKKDLENHVRKKHKKKIQKSITCTCDRLRRIAGSMIHWMLSLGAFLCRLAPPIPGPSPPPLRPVVVGFLC